MSPTALRARAAIAAAARRALFVARDKSSAAKSTDVLRRRTRERAVQRAHSSMARCAFTRASGELGRRRRRRQSHKCAGLTTRLTTCHRRTAMRLLTQMSPTISGLHNTHTRRVSRALEKRAAAELAKSRRPFAHIAICVSDVSNAIPRRPTLLLMTLFCMRPARGALLGAWRMRCSRRIALQEEEEALFRSHTHNV